MDDSLLKHLQSLRKRANRLTGGLGKATSRSARASQTVKQIDAVGIAEALRHAADRLHREGAILDLVDVLLLSIDAGGVIEQVNDFACKALGRTRERLIGANWFETCIPEPQRAKALALHKRLLEKPEGAVRNGEMMVTTRTGRQKLIAWRFARGPGASGQGAGVLLAGHDVTQQRRIAGDLLRSESRLRAVFDTAVDGIILIDSLGTIESFNKSAERIFHYKASEVIGSNVKVLMPTPYRENHDQYLHSYMTTGVKKVIGIGREVSGRRKDGSTFPVDLAIGELEVEGQKMFAGIVRDISDRKQLERAVLETGTQEQRRIGRDIHDGLGQELTGIAFLAGVLRKKLIGRSLPEEKDASEIVGLVNQAIDHARELVNGLCPVQMEPEGLMRALTSLTESVQKMYQVTSRFMCEQPVLIVNPDTATHLYYIAREAINNAIKHAKATRIDVRLARRPNNRIELCIIDDGVGMPPSDLKLPGNGLGSMKYRSRILGGMLEIHPGADRGTVVCCSFELEPRKTSKETSR